MSGRNRARRLALIALVALCAVPLANVGPAFADSVPGVPGTPVALGMQRAAAVQWSAPGDVGSPPLTSYRLEANDGSGWSATPADRGITAMAGGDAHTCALLHNGAVKCWGYNLYGQLGLGNSSSRGDASGEMGDDLLPVALGTGRTAVAVTAGARHTCALLDDATVKCWGDNFSGQLGLGDTAIRGDSAGEMGDSLPSVALGTGRTAVAVAAGNNHTCALLDDGSVKCWGAPAFGSYDGVHGKSADMGDALPALELGTGRTAVSLTSGGSGHVCALLDNGSVKCWGGNAQGQLGLGDNLDRGFYDTGEFGMGDDLPAVPLGAGRTAVALSAGEDHTCAVLDNGSVKCWGRGANGQLGSGFPVNRGDNPGEMGDGLPTVALGSGRTAVAVSAVGDHTCVVLDNGSVKCWGRNAEGQLGLGDTGNRGDGGGEMGDSLPTVALGTGRTAVAVSAAVDHTCVVLDDATVKCWGYNVVGQLGLGDTATRGDGPGEMGDTLPVVGLGGAGRGGTLSTVVALAPGTYQFRVVALSSTGEGDPSGASASVTVVAAPPDAPSGVMGTAGDSEVALTWSAPATDGGAAITDYEVTVYDSSGNAASGVTGATTRSVGSSATSYTFTGLSNGTAYRFRVAALNAQGTGAASALSPTVALPTVPDAPSGVLATAGDGVVALTWSPPASDGGSAITDYEVSVYDNAGGVATGVTGAATRSVGSAATSYTFTGLSNGTAYTFRVAAVNALAAGAASALSAVVIVGSPVSPTGVDATSGSTSAATGPVSVSFTPGADNGSAISSFTATCVSSDGGALGAISGGTSPLTVVALTTGKTYTCTVDASNGRGAGRASAPSPPVVVGSPVPPTSVVAQSGSTTAANGPLVVSFAPGANNGSAITSYTTTCTSSNGGLMRTATGSASPLNVVFATTGKTYTCTVKATNARGAGLTSAASLPVIVGSSAAPTSVVAKSGSTTTATGSLTVTFVIGANNGSAITGQTATCVSSNGGVTRTGTHAGAAAAPITVAATTTGKTYTCTVKATNARGGGLASAASLPVIVGSSAAPTNVVAKSGSTTTATGSLTVTFVIGANNGSTITGQTATCVSSNGGVTRTGTHAGAAAAPITVAATTTGKTYTCTVKATNARGGGLASAASLPVIVGSPAPPTGVSAAHFAAGQIRVTFAGGANNGSVTTSYTATCTSSNGGVSKSKTGTTSPLTVTALTVGKSYTCKVKGTNARGAGLASAASGAAIA